MAKQRIIKNVLLIIAIAIFLSAIILYFALGITKEYDENRQNRKVIGTVKITIDCSNYDSPTYPGGKILNEYVVEAREGDSVFDILYVASTTNNITIDYQGAGDTLYVKAIESLREGDKGPTSGWTYYVNDQFPSLSAGSYKIKDGDVIVWIYSKTQGDLQ